MPPDTPLEPWLSFLNELDMHIGEQVELHCLGGFAAVQAYGLQRATSDIDVISVVPFDSSARLVELAGKQSPLRRKHAVYLDVVTVASVPENYLSRLVEIFHGHWGSLRLFVLEAHDLALTKLERNFERDREDVQHLARSGHLNAEILRQRYWEELRPYVTGRVSWHDQTLQMWLEAYFPTTHK